jgi:hypothetical protein
LSVNAASGGLDGEPALAKRREVLEDIDSRGIIATPANSSINELVTEAARQSIQRRGQHVAIDYSSVPAVRG